MRAVVTGGLGFIGGHIVDLLVEKGWTVGVIDSLDPRVHPPAASDQGEKEGTTFVHGSILDPPSLAKALHPAPDVVFHEAAVVGLGRGPWDAEDFLTTNVLGTAQVLRAMADLPGHPRLVLASSMAVYGEGRYHCSTCDEDRHGTRKTEDLKAGKWEPQCQQCRSPLAPLPVPESHFPRPDTFYARSKLLQEQVALELGATLGVTVVSLRYHNVYGPGMPRGSPYAGVASLFKSRILDAVPPRVHEDGRQLRDFIHVDDVARANLLAALAPEEVVRGRALNIATGRPRSVWDLVTLLCTTLAPQILPELSGTYRPGDPRHVFASVEEARKRLGFESAVSFEEGIARFATEKMRGRAALGGT